MNKFKNALRPKPYTKLLKNRPVYPVELKTADEHHEICSCKQVDNDPCGSTSDCTNMLASYECSKSCPAGKFCRNQKLRNREYAALKIFKTANRGFGVLSVNDLPGNTFVIEYVGELIDTTEMQSRTNRKLKDKDEDFYFFTIEGNLHIDAEFYGNISRFLNHSCEPNCIARKVTVDGDTRLGIYTKSSVKSGDELTLDYQMEFFGDKQIVCLCGSNKCRGVFGKAKKKGKCFVEY